MPELRRLTQRQPNSLPILRRRSHDGLGEAEPGLPSLPTPDAEEEQILRELWQAAHSCSVGREDGEVDLSALR